MSTNMTGGADGGIAIQVKLDTSKASKELTRLEQKILKLQEEVTVGKAKKSALVAQLEQANAELTALQAKTKIDGKSFVISPEDSKRISDLKIQIEQTQTAIEQQNKALSDAQLTLEGVKTRYPYTIYICFLLLFLLLLLCHSTSTDVVRLPDALALMRWIYRSQASFISGINAEKATLSMGERPTGFSPVSKKSQHANKTFTAVSGESCLISSRRSNFILNQLGCLSLSFAIAVPSRHSEPAAGAGLGEALGQLRHGLLECRAVEPAAGHGLPGDLVIRTRQRIGVDGGHVRLDRVLNALDLGCQLVGHAAKFAKLVDLALNFCVAHR